MECVPTEDRTVVVDISSDQGSPPIVVSNDDLDWLGELLYVDAVEGLAEEEDVVVIGESSPLDKLRKRELKGSDCRGDVGDDDDDDDDECLVLDGDPDKLVAVEGDKGNGDGLDSDDLLIVGEKGQVACRDYPHPRHDCVEFPFNTTSHENHCDLCHCYVCDSLAPCNYWGTGLLNSDHCHATDKDGDWKIRRKDLRLGTSTGPIVVHLPAQTLHHGRIPSAADMTPLNLVSQPMTAHQAGQTIIPGSTPIPTNLTQQNLVPRQVIYHPPRKTLIYGNTPSLTDSSLARQQQILQRCSSSVTNRSSNRIYSGVSKHQEGNFKIGLQSHYAPGRISDAISPVQPDGRHVRSRHTSSVPRFNRGGIVYGPSASRDGYVPNNPSCTPQVQCSGKFPENTAVNAGLNKILRQNGRLFTDFPSDVRSGQLNAASTLPNLGHLHASVFCHSSGSISTDLQNVSPIYQQIEGASSLIQLDHAQHQDHVVSLCHEAETMDSAVATPIHQLPIQQTNHHLPQEFDLVSADMNDKWWSENELPQSQILHEPSTVGVDIGMLLFDFETSWNDVTR